MASDPTPKPQTAALLATEKPQTMAQAISQAITHSMTPTGQPMDMMIKPKPKTADMSMTPFRGSGILPPGKTVANPMSAIAPLRGRKERADHHIFPTSEEALAVKQIRDLHSPEGYELEYDSRFVLNIIEEIILRANTIIPGVEERHGTHERLEEIEREAIRSGYTELQDELAYPINKISSELICKCHMGGDVKKVTEEIFQSLAQFSWEAKVAIAFAAFAMQYGEFWLVAQLYRSNPLARSVGLLMDVPEIMGSSEAFHNKFKALTDLVYAMLEVAKSIFEFNDLLNKHFMISRDPQEKMAAHTHFPMAAYWTVRSIVACTSILMNLMAMGHEYMSTAVETWELGSLVHKLAQIKDLLREQKQVYWHKLEEKRLHDAYLSLRRLFDVPHLDNMKILRALINPKDEPLPLYDGTLRTLTSLEVLRKKNVVLLISDLDIPPQEFDILLQLYNESRDPLISRENRFELVWLPIVHRVMPVGEEFGHRHDGLHRREGTGHRHDSLYPREGNGHRHDDTKSMMPFKDERDHGHGHEGIKGMVPWYSPIRLTEDIKQRHKQVQEMMPWYSVAHPSQIDPVVVRFIRDDWNFTHKPMLVVLDPQGKVINHNAINMYWIWGPQAFPFTEMREDALWREVSWNMELLVDSFDQSVVNWLQANRFICVFGGGDMEWIRRFTTVVKSIARQLNIPIELLYVGKSTMKEKVKRNSEIIQSQGMSHVLPEYHMWFFWARLNCMWNSREKLGLSTEFDDKMSQIVSILTFDSSDIEWAVIGRGREETATKRGDIMERVFDEFHVWRERIVDINDFVPVLNDQLRDRRPEYHCSRWFYPGTAARAPTTVTCPECGKRMGKHLMYTCCKD